MPQLTAGFIWGCIHLHHCSCYFCLPCGFKETPHVRGTTKFHRGTSDFSFGDRDVQADPHQASQPLIAEQKSTVSTSNASSSFQDEWHALLGCRLWFLLFCFPWVPQGFDSAAAHSRAPWAGVSLVLCRPPRSAAALPGGSLCADPTGSFQQHAIHNMDRPQGAGQRTVWLCNGVKKKINEEKEEKDESGDLQQDFLLVMIAYMTVWQTSVVFIVTVSLD